MVHEAQTQTHARTHVVADESEHTQGGRKNKRTAIVLKSSIHEKFHALTKRMSSLAQKERDEVAAVDKKLRLESLGDAGNRDDSEWGLYNPENGIMRVDCGDTVANGGGGTDPNLQDRFWGSVGTRYTVQCPEMCGKFSKATVWGCSTFMDASSICKAALIEGKIGYDSGGYVAFEIVEPEPIYGGCAKNAVSEVPVPTHREVKRLTFTSMRYEWYTWTRAEREDAIQRFGKEVCVFFVCVCSQPGND